VPPMVKQTGTFIQGAPAALESFLAQDSLASQAVEQLRLDAELESLVNDISSRAGDLSGPVINTLGRIGGTLISIITVLVLAFMMLIEGPLWKSRFLALQPVEKRKKRQRVMERMYQVIIGYVNGQVLVAAIGAFFTLIALLIGNVVFAVTVNAVALSAVIFLFALIPMVGTTIGAILVVLATLLVSLPYAISIAVFFVIYQQIENATLQPIIQSKASQLTPLTVLVAALLGIGLGGLIGALAAIPIAGCIKVLFEEYYSTEIPDLAKVKEANKR
jgi:predicted PurR-regulated permease PerM